MVKKVIRAPSFTKAIKRVDRGYIDRVEKLILKVIQNPEIGKPMRYTREGTRELYFGSFRLSYSYEKKNDTLILLDLYHKDKK